MRGYVAGALASAALEAVLCLWLVVRNTSLVPQWFSWLIAPGLGALLAALTSNLLLHYLEQEGFSPLAACGASLGFGLVLYLTALHAQAVRVREILRIHW